MDYELYRDITGRPQARLSMGHEALGVWLSEELGADQPRITTLLDKLQQLAHLSCLEHQQPGREFVLNMTPDGVEVRAAQLEQHEDEVAEGLSHYDQESECSCGLEDFARLLEDWRIFTARA